MKPSSDKVLQFWDKNNNKKKACDDMTARICMYNVYAT